MDVFELQNGVISFPIVKKRDRKRFDEFRTKRLVRRGLPPATNSKPLMEGQLTGGLD